MINNDVRGNCEFTETLLSVLIFKITNFVLLYINVLRIIITASRVQELFSIHPFSFTPFIERSETANVLFVCVFVCLFVCFLLSFFFPSFFIFVIFSFC